jgi:hypothetical protein
MPQVAYPLAVFMISVGVQLRFSVEARATCGWFSHSTITVAIRDLKSRGEFTNIKITKTIISIKARGKN